MSQQCHGQLDSVDEVGFTDPCGVANDKGGSMITSDGINGLDGSMRRHGASSNGLSQYFIWSAKEQVGFRVALNGVSSGSVRLVYETSESCNQPVQFPRGTREWWTNNIWTQTLNRNFPSSVCSHLFATSEQAVLKINSRTQWQKQTADRY